MSEPHTRACVGGAICTEDGNAAAIGGADWLSLAAAPTFAIMALLTSAFGDSHADMLCVAGHYASVLGGMVPMYLLMSAFHSAPWLRLISSGWRGACRARSNRRSTR
jgi:hypothetical protein